LIFSLPTNIKNEAGLEFDIERGSASGSTLLLGQHYFVHVIHLPEVGESLLSDSLQPFGTGNEQMSLELFKISLNL